MIALRRAHVDDLDAIAAIDAACFEASWTREMLAQELTREIAVVEVGTDDGVTCGYVCSWRVADEIHLLRVAVLPSRRRRGVGAALVRRVLELAARCGAAFVDLEVARGNLGAVALYRALGFDEVGCRPGYYTHPPDDALLLRAMIPRA